MTTAPVYESHFFNENARRYLLSLRAGVKPDIRPEFGPWEPVVREAEAAFDKWTPAQRRKFPNYLDSLGKLKQYRHMGLKQLLEEKSEQGEVTPKKGMPDLPEAAQREIGLLPRVSPWLKAYIDYSREFSPEGFKDFHIASGLWLLSTVAARRIQVELSDPIVTPLSIILCARTGLFAKTTTARAAKKVIKAAGLRIRLGDDVTTPQRLLYDMAGHVPNNYDEMEDLDKEEARFKLAMSGQIGWYRDEIGGLFDGLNKPGPMAEFADLLRTLENGEDEYRYSTKSGGQDKIINPYLALLGSTTPANMAAHASKGHKFWNDGLLARMLWVCPEPHSFITATMKRGEVLPPETVVNALRDWNQRLGIPICSVTEKVDKKGEGTGHYNAEVEDLPISNVVLADGVIEAFTCYREALRGLMASGNIQDLDGSYVRLPVLGMRIAALIASLENQNYLTLDIWSLAQEIAELFRENLHRLYEQISLPVEGNTTEDILIGFLKTKSEQGVTVRAIVQLGPPELRRLKTDGVRSMLQGLERSGIVTVQKQGRMECWAFNPKSVAESST